MSDVEQMRRMMDDLRQQIKESEEAHAKKAREMERAHKAEIQQLKAQIEKGAAKGGKPADANADSPAAARGYSAEDPNSDLLMAGVWFMLEYLKKSNALPQPNGDYYGTRAPVAESYLSRNRSAATTPAASPASATRLRPSPRAAAPPPLAVEPDDKLETTLSNKEADTLRKAAEKYSSEYQELMKTMVAPKEEEHAKPFIGFSLADNIKEGALVVDGVFDAGPASQVGINIDHELVAVAGERPATFDDVRRLIGKHCKPGHITAISMRNQRGEPYEAELWVMTAEDRFAGKPYFFDTNKHRIRQSDRVKNTYRTRGASAK